MRLKTKLPKIEVEPGYYNLRIFINEILHLSIKTEELKGVQSFFNDTGIYYIDFYAGTQTIECAYTRKDIWIEILRQLVEQKIV